MPHRTEFVLGTRGSALAVAQSQLVADALAEAAGVPVRLEIVSTRGDRDRTRPLSELGGKGLFTAELEEGLREGQLDLAVHSLKDLPTDDAPGLVIACIPKREDPRDALVGPVLDELPQGAIVGTGSLRRAAQLRDLRPDLEIRDIRGNVGTRLRKRDEGQYVATVLAMAGLNRLGIARPDARPLSPAQMVPAVGQGALGIQCRGDDARLRELLTRIEDPASRRCTDAERAFLAAYGGGCNVPAACHAVQQGDGSLWIRAAAVDPAGALVRVERRGEDGVALGQELARAL